MGEASPPSEGNGPMLTEAMKVYNVIKKAVKDDGWMDTDTLKLAIKEMRKEDPCGENSKNSNPSCCKHYFNPLYVIKSLDGKYQSLETAMSDIILEEQEINDSRCHNSERQVLCIPVIHGEETENAKCAGQHWTLYAFHLNSRKVSILDSRRSETSDTRRHQSPWHLICDILDKYDRFKVKSSDKPWEVDILKSAPEQPNSNDCGFYVFKFMRRWDGDKLDKSWKPPESIELRKEFLEYMLTPDALKDISSIDLAELYEYTIDYSGSKEEVWISSTYPTQISLDVKSIQNLLNISGCMDTKSLNLAIRKMVIMKSNDGNSADSKPLSFKHYISADFARYAISKEDEHTNMETCILHDFMDHHSASNPQVLCIPVMHEGHWTLYAFNMDDEKVSILDPSLNMDDEKVSILDHKRHKSIRLKICKALECAKAKSYLFRRKSGNFSCWKYEFVKVTRNKKSCDSGFIIFNYMLWWDGGKLDESKMPSVTDSINLRKKFLEYILCFKDNLAYQQPHGLSKLIETLSSARTRRRCLMDNELLNVLIEGKAVPEKMDKELLFRGITTDGEGVLHISARIGDMKVVRAIFDKFQVGNLLPISNSTTKNHKVCSKKEANNDKEKALKIVIDGVGKEKIIEFADFLMTRNYRGETCLHEAIRWDRKELVTSLILVDQQVCKDDMPSLVKRVDYGGISPLYLATMLGRTDIVLSLTKKDDGYKVLAPSSAGPGGRSALHAAILTKNKKLIKQLVEWNPDLKSEQDKCGSNPLHIMASVKGLDVTELLPGSHADHQHSKGPCDFLKKDSEGMLPIHVAASNGRLEIIKRLLKACRHCMCSRNASGQSFLHVAVEKKWVGVVRHVCKEQTLDGILNLQDHDGNTALHLAVKRGYQLIFCFLMSNPGVCLNLPNKEGHTPRDLATLGIDPHLKLLQNSRVLISLHLRLAGAKFATCRKDEQYMAAKHIDKENPSDKLTKFAGPMAVCAIFMLNISVAAFFSIAKSYLPSMDPNAPPAPAPMAVSNSKRAFKALIISDTIAFSSAALAAFCSTFAALSVMDRPTRLLYIRTGGTALQIASMAVVAVFVLAVYLAFGPIDSILPTIAGVLGLVALSPQCTPLFFIILHAWTLIYRSMLFDSIHKYIVLKTQTTLKQLPSFVANSSVSICGIVYQLLGPVLDILCMCLMMLGKLICCIPLLIGFAVVGAIAALICFLSPW